MADGSRGSVRRAASPHHFGDGGIARREHRGAAGHGLQQGESEALVEREEGKGEGAAVEQGKVLGRHVSGQDYPPFQAQF